MAGQSPFELRNANKQLKEMLRSSNARNLELQDIVAQMREDYKMASGRSAILEKKIENYERLIGVYEKRLGRMADRLTTLAAERNGLYSQLVEAQKELDRQLILEWEEEGAY